MRSFPASAMYLHVFRVTSQRSFFLGLEAFLETPEFPGPPPFPPQPAQLAMAHLAVITVEAGGGW